MGIYVLRGSDLSSVVVTLATSVETLDAAQRAVMTTELTPGGAALLPGPTASRSTASGHTGPLKEGHR